MPTTTTSFDAPPPSHGPADPLHRPSSPGDLRQPQPAPRRGRLDPMSHLVEPTRRAVDPMGDPVDTMDGSVDAIRGPVDPLRDPVDALGDPIDGMSGLATPINLAGLDLPNRLVMAPMTRFRSPGGVPTAEVADYYRRRAANGIGLIITEGTLVGHASASHETTVPRMTPGAAEAGWRLVTDAVHASGGRIATQLWHLGSERRPTDGIPAWTPSGLGGHPMTSADIDTIIAAFAESARVAARAGFDAVEIHAAHGYLLDEFLWPATNRRTDAFGGSPARRAAFPAEILRAVRAELPRSIPLILRFSQFKERDYDARIADSPTELASILSVLADAGADVFHASQRRFWEPAFDGSPLNLAGWAKKLTGRPSITVGSVGLTSAFPRSPEMAGLVAGLAAGDYDLVALGRALLGNPAWACLVTADRLDLIRDYDKSHEDEYR